MRIVIVVCLLVIVSCSNKMASYKSYTAKQFDYQAHRGGRGLMPENTIPAMLDAVKRGVTTLEMDAVITKDKQVVLSHEPFFNHEITTRPDGTLVTEEEEKTLNIFEMPYSQVATYDVGLKPHPRFKRQQKMKVAKPRLVDVVDKVEAYVTANNLPKPYYNIETKSNPATDDLYHPEPAEFVDLLMKVISIKLIDKRVIIQSFDQRTLQYLHKNYPHIKTALLIEEYDKRPLAVQLADLGFSPTIYSPAFELVTEDLIRKCHDLGILIIPWTVNEKDKMKQLKKMGVDGLITDYPDIKL